MSPVNLNPRKYTPGYLDRFRQFAQMDFLHGVSASWITVVTIVVLMLGLSLVAG